MLLRSSCLYLTFKIKHVFVVAKHTHLKCQDVGHLHLVELIVGWFCRWKYRYFGATRLIGLTVELFL